MDIEPEEGPRDADTSREPIMPVHESEISTNLSEHSLPEHSGTSEHAFQKSFPADLLNKERIIPLSVTGLLRREGVSLCHDKASSRYYVSGRENAEIIRMNLVKTLDTLKGDRTLLVGFQDVCATSDFVEDLIEEFYFQKSKYRQLIQGKQVVFYAPNYTTIISLRRAFEHKGEINTGCMVLEAGASTTLVIIGHLEPFSVKLLSYIRQNYQVTAHELSERYPGEVTAKLAELWEIGVVRRQRTWRASEKARRPSYSYNVYHPDLDIEPDLPIYTRIALEYRFDFVRRMRRNPAKPSNSEQDEQ